MNLRKLKRLTSVVLSLSMVFSMNMTAFAMETAPTEPVAEETSHEHILAVDESQSTPATCGEEGVEVKVCECGYSETETVAATGEHTEDYTLIGDEVVTSCTVCGKELSRAPYENNFELFASDVTEEQCKENDTHTVVRLDRKPASCFEEGVLAHYWCETCETEYMAVDSDHALTEEERVSLAIPRKDHNPRRVAKKLEPTCTEPGNIEYFTCDNCENLYRTPEDLAKDYATPDPTLRITEEDTVLEPLGHTYVDEDKNSTCVFTADEDFNPLNYVENTASGVTATRTCARECGNSQTGTVSVVKTKPAGFSCEDGGDLTYTATVTFTQSDDIASGETFQETHDYKVTVNGHSRKLVVVWDALQLSAGNDGNLAIDASNVTAQRSCVYCDEDVPSTNVTISLPNGAESYPLSCSEEQSLELTATAEFATPEASDTSTETKTFTLPKKPHTPVSVEAIEVTCDNDGTYAHVKCSACESLFWDEIDAANPDIEPLTVEDVTIRSTGHTFSTPEFDPNGVIVTAKFTCTKTECGAWVKKNCYEIAGDDEALPPTDVDSKNCGETVNYSYPVKVWFDRYHVAPKAGGAEKEYAETVSDTSEDYDGISYSGFAPKPRTLEHNFTANVTGNGTDVKNGVTITLACGRTSCGKTIELNSTQNSGDNENPNFITGGTLTGATDGTITIGALDESSEDYKANTCTGGGTDVFPVTVTCKTNDNTKDQYTVNGSLKLTTEKLGHDYVVDSMEADTTQATPTITTLHVSCTRADDCGFAGETFTSADNPSSLDIQSSTDTDLGYVAKNCTTDGNDVWTVAATVADGTTVSVNDTEQTLTITKTSEHTGHDFTGSGTWDWSAFGDADTVNGNDYIIPKVPEGKVYYSIECSNPNCGGAEDTDKNSEVDGPEYVTVTKGDTTSVRVQKKPAEVTSTIPDGANCGNEDGFEKTYTATVSGVTPDDTKKQKITGHSWGEIEWDAEWDTSSTDMKDSDITLADGTKFQIPVRTIGASRACEVCPASETFDTTSSNPNGSVVITERTEKNTCTKTGSTIYLAKVVLAPETEEGASVEVVCGTPHVEIYKATGHAFDITWAWQGLTAESEQPVPVTPQNEKDIIEYVSATATKTCANECGVTIQPEGTVTVTASDNVADGISCTTPDVFIYTASASFKDVPTDVYTDTQKVVHIAKGHNYTWTVNKASWTYDEEDLKPGTFENLTIEGVCKNNENHKVTVSGASLNVTSEDDINYKAATCMAGKTLEVTGTFTGQGGDGKDYTGTATYTAPSGEPDLENGHDYSTAVIDWDALDLDTLEPVKTEGEGENAVYVYDLTATCACGLNAAAEHTKTVDVKATALVSEVNQLKEKGCKAEYTVNYTLALKEADPDLTLDSTYAYTHAAKDHKMKRHSAVEATCVIPGHETYFECEVCRNTYTSMMADTPYEYVEDAPLGHIYGSPKFYWNEEGKTASAKFTCVRSGCSETDAGHERVFAATVLSNQVYVEDKPGCPGQPNPANGKGYMMIRITLAGENEEIPAGFSKKQYDGDLPVVLLPVNHDYENGTCTLCGSKSADVVTVIFKDGNSEYVKNLYDKTKMDGVTINIPVGPVRSGYNFMGWSIDGTTVPKNIADEIRAKILAGNDVTVTPIYEKTDNPGTVTVQYRKGTKKADGTYDLAAFGEADASVTGKIGTYANITLKDITDTSVKFSHWADETGAVLSTEETYRIFIQTTSVTIQAVYVTKDSETEQAAPTVVISNMYNTPGTTSNTISFVASMNIPEGYTGVESGMIYTTNSACGNDTSKMAIDNVNAADDKIRKMVFETTDYVTNILTVNVGTNTANFDKPVFARAYVICTKTGAPAERIVVYSTIKSVTFNQLSAKSK